MLRIVLVNQFLIPHTHKGLQAKSDSPCTCYNYHHFFEGVIHIIVFVPSLVLCFFFYSIQ